MITDISQLCIDKEWPEVRKYLSSDAAEQEKKSNIMYHSYYGTCLHRACCHRTPDDIIKAIIDIGGKELVMKVDLSDRTALHYACRNGASYNIIKILIEVGGKDLVMAKSGNGNNAMHWFSYDKRTKNYNKKIDLIFQVGDTNLLMSAKNHAGNTPNEILKKASKKIKKLLQDARNSAANTNNDPKDTNRQKLQRRLKQSQKAAKKFQQDYDKKCENYSGLKKSMMVRKKEAQEAQEKLQKKIMQMSADCGHLQKTLQSERTDKLQLDNVLIKKNKEVEAQGAEMCTLLQQKMTFEKDNTILKGRVEKIMQICSEQQAKLQVMEDAASASITGIQMLQQEDVEASNIEQVLEESNKKAADLVATVEAQRVTIVALSNEKDDIEKECRDEVDTLTRICSQRREELQLLIEESNKKAADLVATVKAQRVTIVALSNEKDDIEKECRDEVDKLTQRCSQRREELQLLIEESNKKAADLVATVKAQRVTIVALSNEKDDIEKECRDEVDKVTQMCSQLREELQLLIDSRNGEGTKRKYSVDEHQEEEGSGAVSQSQSQSSKRSRLESATDTALVASDRKQSVDDRLESITCQLLNEREQHSKLIQQSLDAQKELKDVKARNVQLEEDAILEVTI
jgi:predicted P-loop ATPase/GTPase